jgi:drug/metabolite transporter (DMT)-like permease
MNWVILAISGYFCWALTNVVDKVIREKYIKNSLAMTAAFGIGTVLSSLLLLPFIGVPSIPLSIILMALAAGFLNTAGVFFYVKALSVEEASRVVPLFNLNPVLTLLLAAVFLGESLSAASYAAFASILLGGIILSSHKIKGVFRLSPALFFVAISTVFIAFMGIITKYAYTQGYFWKTFLVVQFSIGFSQMLLFMFPSARKGLFGAFSANKSGVTLALFGDAFFSTIARVLSSMAILAGPITIVSVLVSFQAFFVLAIATFLSVKFPIFLKESIDPKTLGTKIVAIGIMGIGLFFLYY